MADVGVRTFAQVNSTFSALTGVPTNNAAVAATYKGVPSAPGGVQQQLPPIPTLEGFSAANQVGVAQLAIQYCNQMMTTPALRSKIFPPSVTFGGTQFSTAPGISAVTAPLAALAVGNGLNSQPAAATVSNELNSLIGILCTGSTPCLNNAPRVVAVASAACAAALGNADVLIN
jgi:hypothetical protein